ncbi:hypothetical protein FOL47_008212 [Perkinsus chesapeaki]|uniref:Uncharacterized protein n=1 Tax=Perkinsus chesapeaki TaxID=330153 RepID=A0A7J6LFF9_PERCH|nr:hypothetical protein FOL47_008212 [Perkinsus chesapeaki]
MGVAIGSHADITVFILCPAVRDSRKFQEAQCMYGAMAVIPSLAVYGSILVSVESPYSNNRFRYYSLPGPLGDWSAEWMQYRVDDDVIQEERSLRIASIYGLLLSGLLTGVLLVRSEMDKLLTCRQRPSPIGQILSLITTLAVLFLSPGPSRRVAPWNGYSVMVSMAIAVVLCAFSFSRSRSQSGVALSGVMALGCWWTSWRAVNAFDAEEWDASRSLLEFLTQIWGWENVIAMAVCYLTDPSNSLVVLCCLGGFVLERGLRELLDFTRGDTDVGQQQQSSAIMTEALLLSSA